MKNLTKIVATAIVLAFICTGNSYAKSDGNDFADNIGKGISGGIPIGIGICDWGYPPSLVQPQWMTNLGITQEQVDVYYAAHEGQVWPGGTAFFDEVKGKYKLPSDFWKVLGPAEEIRSVITKNHGNTKASANQITRIIMKEINNQDNSKNNFSRDLANVLKEIYKSDEGALRKLAKQIKKDLKNEIKMIWASSNGWCGTAAVWQEQQIENFWKELAAGLGFSGKLAKL